ncbi:hypothetical protein BKA62DRAFT_687913 [Auriculariales sp. MPI-PUGE-AT-0066]|nr:hypothetical protein BKA62DRAFT_687913 [Auriculariales sp. MPI-PUGE-AT-0066]
MPDFFAVGLVIRTESDPPYASIYAPNVRLSYTPPTQLPSPFPATLHVEGIPLYHASAVFVRHTLATLYSDLRIEMRNFAVINTGHRQRHVRLGIGVHGTARVTRGEAQWDVTSTYHFSPITGLVEQHVVDSIHPAPHLSAFDALKRLLSGSAFTDSVPQVRPCRIPVSQVPNAHHRSDSSVAAR